MVTSNFEYIYQGDRLSRTGKYAGMQCSAVRQHGKCIRGKNGNMLVIFEDGRKQIILARQLRKIHHNESTCVQM